MIRADSVESRSSIETAAVEVTSRTIDHHSEVERNVRAIGLARCATTATLHHATSAVDAMRAKTGLLGRRRFSRRVKVTGSARLAKTIISHGELSASDAMLAKMGPQVHQLVAEGEDLAEAVAVVVG